MRTRLKILAGVGSVVVAAILSPARPASAFPPTAQGCQAAKLLAAGIEGRALLACARRNLATGTDPACVAAAVRRRDNTFERAEARGDCMTTGDSAVIGAINQAMLDTALATLRPGGPAASRCTAAQLAAAGRAARKLGRAYSLDELGPDLARLNEALSDLRHEFWSMTFPRAVAKGDCLSSVNASNAYTIVDNAALFLRGKLRPFCGDGVRTATESCDRLDRGSCPGLCLPDCTCASPACGDGIVQPGEECDGGPDDEGVFQRSCPDTPPGEYGCFPTGCQCCAQSGACYIRGFGTVTPIEIPCCEGTCEIPGPEAGPDVMVTCTLPPSCPCWTTASLDAAFPPGFFEENGRGGVQCSTASLQSVDICYLEFPSVAAVSRVAALLPQPRSGAGVSVTDRDCWMSTDLDPDDAGFFCDAFPILGRNLREQDAEFCLAQLQASQVFQALCP